MRILLLLLILYTAAEQSGEQHPSPQSSGDPSSEQKKAACHTAGLVKGSHKKEACTIVRAGKHESQIECAACGTIQACPSKSTSYSATSAKYFELVQTGTAKDVSKWVGLCETETASKKTAGMLICYVLYQPSLANAQQVSINSFSLHGEKKMVKS